MSNTITKIVPEELIVLLSKERMLAVFGGMIKSELIRRAPARERDFIAQFFEKRLVLMSMQSCFPSLAGTAKDEFARRVHQAILDFDARAFDVSGDRLSLERSIISFVLPNTDAIRNYMTHFRGDPYIGGYLRSLVDSYAKVMNERATHWT